VYALFSHKAGKKQTGVAARGLHWSTPVPVSSTREQKEQRDHMKKIPNNQWTRREFTAQSVLAMLSSVAISMTGCGDSDSPSTPSIPTTPAPAPTPPPPAGQNATGVVGSNHGHTAVVSAAQLSGGSDVTIDITGDSNHPHAVDLSAGELSQIAAGTRVQKSSTTNASHAHTVTFN